MIILDTNILRGTGFRSSAAELLRAIRASGVERVAAPRIAMEEIAAQRAIEYDAAHDEVATATKQLDRVTFWTTVAQPAKADAEFVRQKWRDRYASLAEVIPTSLEAHEQALFREANRIAPCKVVTVEGSGKDNKKKTGARDAAIWLTAVEYARDNENETVYFVSADSDFGDGKSVPSEMLEDIKPFGDRFVIATSLDTVLARLATETEASEQDVRPLLESDESLWTVMAEARIYATEWPIATSTFIDGEIEPLPPLQPMMIRDYALKLQDVSDIRSYEVGSHPWFTVTARWLVTFRPTVGHIAYTSWETRVLVSPTAENGGLTVLRTGRFMPVGPDDATALSGFLPPEPLRRTLLEQQLRGGLAAERILPSQLSADAWDTGTRCGYGHDPETTRQLLGLLAKLISPVSPRDENPLPD
ncbi:hypothetical protein VM98_07710 [Streptomyces rubellomurinus subsp. indigoferus]|nr:hypothetical protein VM98_07710 [Streptomyces rubellomurinus subsp. indigoferus]